MLYDPDKYHRRSIRLAGYDYRQAGAYFVTINTRERLLFFEDTPVRDIAAECWLAISEHFPQVTLDEYVIMPNHVHGIIVITGEGDPRRDVPGSVQSKGVQLNAPTDIPADAPTADDENKPRDPDNHFSVMSPHRDTLAVIVRTFKAAVTTRCRREGFDEFGWQRNYYEHIIRDEQDLHHIRCYIRENPANWSEDPDHPTLYNK